MNNGIMLNAYPDSMGERLSDVVSLLERPEMKDAFRSFYILPSLFTTDLDRGFSVVSYDLESSLASRDDFERLKALGMDLKLDFILNHLSVQSPQFKDILEKGDASPYRDFFIDWNAFWQGTGDMTDEGYIRPRPEYIRDMFFRKPGLPLLMVRLPDGKKRPYWNTFYQRVTRDESGNERYLGQMDLNLQSPLVWQFYQKTLETLAGYGASIVRLDAFAYAPKAPGRRNFLNEPETWETLERIHEMAEPLGLTLLPEIHASYGEKTYEKLARMGYMTYDFFLPGLIIDALETGEGDYLAAWAGELRDKRISVVNMLGCHDGIPLLDLRGLLPEERIQSMIALIVSRGGRIKNLHGQKNVYYQVNASYFSALGADERKLLLARAIQLFMPGKPQVWYYDLFAGENALELADKAGEGGHKEINRRNLTKEEAEAALQKKVVREQLTLMRLRNTCPAFGGEMALEQEKARLAVRWTNAEDNAALYCDLKNHAFTVRVNGETVFVQN